MIHTTKPVKTNKAAVVSQRFGLSGFKKIHILLFRSVGTIIPMPMSVYGNVKSTYKDLLAVIVVSPTTASNF